jgi:hypothetical protein
MTHSCHDIPIAPANACQVFEAGGARIVQFSSQDQEGFAVDNQLGGRAAFGEMRNWGGRVCLSARWQEREPA